MAPSTHYLARVREVIVESLRAVTLRLDLLLPAQPGQFVMVWLPGIGEKPFSVVADDPVELTVMRVGSFSERLQQLQAGDAVYLRGPLGKGFSLQGERPLLVGGGCGAAPLAFLAHRLNREGRPVAVALGARTAGELLLLERFALSSAMVLPATEDGTAGTRGLVTEVVEPRLSSGLHDMVYACGPVPMLERVGDLCRQYGVPGEMSWEAYMRCGIGVCGSCDRGDGLLVCRDGPVFPV